MQKLGLSQTLSQKLSPQQIQFIKLLQVPTAELDTRIEEELEINPALEEGKEDEVPDNTSDEVEIDENIPDPADEINVDDYIREEDYTGYKMQGDGISEEKEMPLATTSSLNDSLISQLGFLNLDQHQDAIGRHLIGSIEGDGYIRRELEAIINDLAFSQNIYTDLDEVEGLLEKIQSFDPPGFGLSLVIISIASFKSSSDSISSFFEILSKCFFVNSSKHSESVR